MTSYPARPEELRRYVDVAAAGRPDTFAQEVYSQGWTLYFRSPRFEYVTAGLKLTPLQFQHISALTRDETRVAGDTS